MKQPLVCLLLLLPLGCATSSPAERPPRQQDAPPAAVHPAPKPAAPEPPDLDRTLVKVDANMPEAPDVAARLQVPRHDVDAEMELVLGHTSRKFSRGQPEGALGNFVADIMREAAAETIGRPVHMAWTNVGGLRADLPGGVITRGSVLEVMPFDNSVVVFELTGEGVRDILKRSAAHNGDPISGVTYRIADKEPVDIIIDGAPLSLERVYTLCTNDYVVDGGGNYDAVKKAKNVNRTGVLIRDAMEQHFQRAEQAGQVVDVDVGGRIKVESGRAP